MAETPSDIINDLPDEILASIVCRLPVREMLATALLSRRWQNIWNQAPNLEIDLFDDRDVTQLIFFDHWEPDVALCQILHRHSAKLGSCIIFIAPYRQPRWMIPFLSKKGITKLEITYRFSPTFRIDASEFLSIPSLRELSLTKFYVSDTVRQASPVGLRSLVLTRVILPSHDYLKTLISNTPHLESLILSDCLFLRSPIDHEEISISAPMLKLLEIETVVSTSLNLDAPALITLRLHQLTGLEELKMVVPSIRTLIITDVEILNLFNNLYQLNLTPGINRLNSQEASRISLHSCNSFGTAHATSQHQFE